MRAYEDGDPAGAGPPLIAVGLGGSGGWHALAWAVEEAAARGAALLLCHACPADSALARGGPHPPIALLELADPALARAVSGARNRLAADRVRLSVRAVRPSALLLTAASRATLLVVGAPGWSGAGGLGSTAHRVAAQAACPVVVVRPLRPEPAAPFAGHVVVGVDGTEAGRAALGFGFRHADRHRRPLAAVHVVAGRPYRSGPARSPVPALAMTPATAGPALVSATAGPLLAMTPATAGPALVSATAAPTLTITPDAGSTPDAPPAALEADLAGWRARYPGVPVTTAVWTGRPLPALLAAAAGAPLLVLGDHGHGPIHRAILGTVSDGALDGAGCPVAVVPRQGDRAVR